MIALLYYVTAALVIVWQLPKVRGSGQRRTTLVWALLWVLALVLAGVYFCWKQSWGMTDWIMK